MDLHQFARDIYTLRRTGRYDEALRDANAEEVRDREHCTPGQRIEVMDLGHKLADLLVIPTQEAIDIAEEVLLRPRRVILAAVFREHAAEVQAIEQRTGKPIETGPDVHVIVED